MNCAPPAMGTTNPWATPEQLEPWQRPLGSSRAGRLGAVIGHNVNGLDYPDRQAAEVALRAATTGGNPLAGNAYGTHLKRDMAVDLNPGYRADCVELVVDGVRLIEAAPGRWVDARTGKPWRRPQGVQP